MTALDTVPDIPGDSIRVLREQLGLYDAKEEELRLLARVAATLNLSVPAGQIVMVGRWDRRANRTVYRPQITVDGRRARAERTGLLDGIEGPVWCGPREFDDHGKKLPLEWDDVWDTEEAYPYCARVLVYRKDWGRPSNGTAKWSEFAQYVKAANGGQQLSPFWYRMPSHMLGKVAESLALRRAFPNDESYRIAAAYSRDDTESVLIEATASAQASPPEIEGRVPDHVRDDQPEAYGSEPGSERYDPTDASRPFA